MRGVVAVLCVLSAALCYFGVSADAPATPTFPAQWTARYVSQDPSGVTRGAWYYDSVHKRLRIDTEATDSAPETDLYFRLDQHRLYTVAGPDNCTVTPLTADAVPFYPTNWFESGVFGGYESCNSPSGECATWTKLADPFGNPDVVYTDKETGVPVRLASPDGKMYTEFQDFTVVDPPVSWFEVSSEIRCVAPQSLSRRRLTPHNDM
eukprot:gnl/Hemi2/25604_TR8604_c0_g6_i1.p1 gnl/Hemi2/25604_TR8604_c0_g6~~gnl/Hemi2/25604_TR8604_c0_g6_i1.p1  ORF type:complete len:207 (-),score=42.87 gnl/Hemi2/25604_TR8604_c0_g6_i1:77-697(-)